MAWTAVGIVILGGASGCPLQARIARAGLATGRLCGGVRAPLSGVPCTSTGGSLAAIP
jgi:hypothetical protein